MKSKIITLLFMVIMLTDVDARDDIGMDANLIGGINTWSALIVSSDIHDLDTLEINIEIDSGGGEVDAGQIIMGTMLYEQSRGKVINCYVTGRAMSMAFSILQFCDNRYAFYDASFMQHHARLRYSNGVISEPLRYNVDNILRLVTDLNRIHLKYWEYLFWFIEDERIFNSVEALSIGAIDEILYIGRHE